MASFLVCLLALASLNVASPVVKRDTSPIYNGASVGGKTYDYVIAGGGLAGSVLAARLSENTARTVLLIEAGYNEEGRDTVYDATKYTQTFGTWLDWQYQTVPQSNADNKPQIMRAGRALGGSTCINGLAWTKPHTFQIDALQNLGNPGLNWASLQPYMLRAENGVAPSSSQASAGLTWSQSCHGTSGPIAVQFDPSANPNTLERSYNTTAANLGMPYSYDLTCGNPVGRGPIAYSRSGNIRSDAYRGYLYQKSKPNLTILSGANVGRVNFGSNLRATGVEFVDENGNRYNVTAGREVIMATGSLKTPSILQQSGVGPSALLSSVGVRTLVDLPIGQNLIDQTTSTTTFTYSGNRGGGQSIAWPSFSTLFSNTNDANTARSMLTDQQLTNYAQAAVSAGSFTNATALKQILAIQADWILNRGAAISESFDYGYTNGGTNVFGYDSWYLLPFGRGSVKIADSNPYGGRVNIDPRYFMNQFDTFAQGATVKLTRTLSTTSPLSGQISSESTPGTGSVPSGASAQTWANWAKSNYRANWHPIGTVAMMSKALGGSVDSNYNVYGTTGLRVVDASILPLQVSAHLSSVMYGLAERAADVVKAANP